LYAKKLLLVILPSETQEHTEAHL